MTSINKVILIGRLGKPAEIRQTKSGTSVASFSIATSEKFKTQSGEWEEKTEWHNIVAWAKTAEFVGKYTDKGSQVYIEGPLSTRSWDDKDGNKRYSTEITARELKIVSGWKEDNNSSVDSNSNSSDNNHPTINDDDIPF